MLNHQNVSTIASPKGKGSAPEVQLISKLNALLGSAAHASSERLEMSTRSWPLSLAHCCAAVEFIARRERMVYGAKYSSYPEYMTLSGDEYRQCCLDVEYPRASNTQSHYRHSCTAKHVSSLYGVGAQHLRQAVALLEADEEVVRRIQAMHGFDLEDLLRVARRHHAPTAEVGA